MIILGNGESIDRTAEFLKVSPRTIYAGLHRFTEDSSLPIETRLKDKPRSGRPHKTFTTAKEILNERNGWNIDERSDEDKIYNLIFQLLSNPPHRAGYKNPMWYFELLNQYIKESFSL
jgi:transposase